MNKILNISHKLMSVAPNSKLMYLLILPPFYSLWLWGVLNTVIPTSNIKRVVSIIFIIIAVTINLFFISYPYLLINKSPILENNNFKLTLIIGCFLLSIFILILARYSLKYEKNLLDQKKDESISIIDYFVRYFLMINWIMGVWSLQNFVNKYEIKKANT
jgi:hypothetical protein